MSAKWPAQCLERGGSFINGILMHPVEICQQMALCAGHWAGCQEGNMSTAEMTLFLQEWKHKWSCSAPTTVMLTYPIKEEFFKEVTFTLLLAFRFLIIETPLSWPQDILYLAIFCGLFDVERRHRLIAKCSYLWWCQREPPLLWVAK